MRRPSYRRAIRWVASTDNSEIGEDEAFRRTLLVAHLFGKHYTEVGAAISKEIARLQAEADANMVSQLDEEDR